MLEKSTKKNSIFDFSFNLLLAFPRKSLPIEELSIQVSISEQTDNGIPCYLYIYWFVYTTNIDNTMICGFWLLPNTNLGWDIEERKHCS